MTTLPFSFGEVSICTPKYISCTPTSVSLHGFTWKGEEEESQLYYGFMVFRGCFWTYKNNDMAEKVSTLMRESDRAEIQAMAEKLKK